MKKLLYTILLFIFLLPIVVNAAECDTSKVYIDSITIDDNNKVEEIDAASAKDKKVNLNLRMATKDDEILYKLVLKNDSEDDYEINKNSIVLNSDYIEYTLESDNNNIVKAKSSRTVYLRVKYKTEVDPSSYVNGVYQDNITMKVNLRSDDTPAPSNPNTGVSYIIISLILIISGITLIVFKKKKISSLMILVGILLLPIGVKALCSCEILVDSKVQIVKGNTFCTYYKFINEEKPYIKYYTYLEDETFEQYLERDPSKYEELGLQKGMRYTNGVCASNTIMFGTLEQLGIANLNDPYYDTITTIKYPEDKILPSEEGCYHMLVNGPCM